MISIYITTGVSIFMLIFGLILFLIALTNDDCEQSFKIITGFLSLVVIVAGVFGIYKNINNAHKLNTVEYYNEQIIQKESELNELKEMKNQLLKKGEDEII